MSARAKAHAAGDRLELIIPGRPEYLRHIRGWCEALMRDLGFDDGPIADFNLALTEACANTIEHCLGMDAAAHLHLECVLDRRRFEVSIVNFCHAADLGKIKPRPLGQVAPRGLGTRLIRRASDHVRYEPNGEGGIRLTLTKLRRPKKRRRA
jgi:anti-sigma regulatory factor (Ser/Thr protein kinase)